LFAPVANQEALIGLQEIAAREFSAAARPLSPNLYAEDDAGQLVALESRT
jgi:hypothetical protein